MTYIYHFCPVCKKYNVEHYVTVKFFYFQPGYNGSDCEADVDGCEPNQCRNNGRCTDQPNGFRCSCPSGNFNFLCSSMQAKCITWDELLDDIKEL